MLEQLIGFIIEADKLKQVYRQNFLMDGSRYENDAEHSWHLALMCILLSEYAKKQDLNLLKSIKMALIHDIVEIDAGDTYCYDIEAEKDKPEREQKAADRLFGMLPQSQAQELRCLWEEFEECQSGEARFVAALDKLQPLLCNYLTKGRSWQIHGIKKEQVIKRNGSIIEGSEKLWQFVLSMLNDAVERGYLPE
ncbi:MAG: HD domain-containing protein [Dethiobacter sp.]|jgi:putative hydrolase of HD superfamily|nr:HD domain-containing protein [Dethiobacter sp.]